MDLSNFRMDLWEKIVPTFKFNPEIPFFEMLVPTMDTVRYGYLMEKLLAIKHPVLFTGTTGVGKVSHVIVHHVLHAENTNLETRQLEIGDGGFGVEGDTAPRLDGSFMGRWSRG